MKNKVKQSAGRGRPSAKIVYPRTKEFRVEDVIALNPHVARITVQKRMEQESVGRKSLLKVNKSPDWIVSESGRGRPPFVFALRAQSTKKTLAAIKDKKGEISLAPEVATEVATELATA